MQLKDDQDLVHSMRVPPRLASVQFTLHGQVKSLSENKSVDLQAAQTYAVNQIEKSFATEDLHLRLDDQGYWLDVSGQIRRTEGQSAGAGDVQTSGFPRPGRGHLAFG